MGAPAVNADDTLTIKEAVFLAVFILLVFVVPVAVAWATYSEKSRIDLRTLWTHQGRIDKFAIIIMGTWWVHTCSMILWTLLRTVATSDYATYVAWAIPIIAKMFAPSVQLREDSAPAPAPAPAKPATIGAP